MAKPEKLYIAQDGAPLQGKEAWQKVKDLLLQIQFDGELILWCSDTHLGCKKAVSSAITSFFEKEEKGIILEDDTLPSPNFFRFCDELLTKFEHTPEIGMISGNNKKGFVENGCSYETVAFCNAWGWATWKRAWERFDYKMVDYPIFQKQNGFQYVSAKKQIRQYWKRMMDQVYYPDSTDIWDYQWSYAIWKNKSVCISPAVNLISNIGFGPDATHTLWEPDAMNNMPRFEMSFPLHHPKKVKVNAKADLNFNIFYKIYFPKSVAEQASELAAYFHPKKNPVSIRVYQRFVRPVLVKLGLKQDS